MAAKKSYSVKYLNSLKVATLRGIATRNGVKRVASKTKAQLIKGIKTTSISCSVAGHNMHAKKKAKRTAGARKLKKC